MSYAICSVKMGTHVAVCMKGLKPVLANIGLQMLSVDSLRKKIYKHTYISYRHRNHQYPVYSIYNISRLCAWVDPAKT